LRLELGKRSCKGKGFQGFKLSAHKNRTTNYGVLSPHSVCMEYVRASPPIASIATPIVL
jgi:hypothetical protein